VTDLKHILKGMSDEQILALLEEQYADYERLGAVDDEGKLIEADYFARVMAEAFVSASALNPKLTLPKFCSRIAEETMKEKVKARQYWAVRHNGDNGDLILGRVKSVRTTGEVVLTNLLTGKLSTKKINVLLVRNKRIKKEQADVILDIYQRKGRPAARAEAVRMKSPYEPRQEQLPLRDGNAMAAAELNRNLEQLVQEINLKMQLVIAEFTSKLLDLVKASL
jgi:hypothetical protein